MITVDYKDRTPIYEQVVQNIEKLIALDVLKQDDKLPSVRQLATKLSINPNTIQKAYAILEQKGVIYTFKGVGNFISKDDLSVKNHNLDRILGDIEKKMHEAMYFGLNEQLFDEWERRLRRILNDSDNKPN